MNALFKLFATGTISLVFFTSFTATVQAVPGQWSSNGSSIYYNEGKVGLGTKNPTWKFQINTTGATPALLVNGDGTFGTMNTRLFQVSNGVGRSLSFHANGRVGIGTVNPTKTLSVNGVILAKEVMVSTASVNWPDYVFEDDYNLMSLDEVEAFINENKHLPNIPSQGDVSKEGLSLGEMQRLHMEKIEELTLHLIEKEKQIESQDERIAKLESLLNI